MQTGLYVCGGSVVKNLGSADKDMITPKVQVGDTSTLMYPNYMYPHCLYLISCTLITASKSLSITELKKNVKLVLISTK